MKTFFGIEKLKLKGRRVDGGYVVRGALTWAPTSHLTVTPSFDYQNRRPDFVSAVLENLANWDFVAQNLAKA